MPTVYDMDASYITVLSPGGSTLSLGNTGQGTGEHLVDGSVTFGAGALTRTIEVNDTDPNYDDNDGSQTLTNPEDYGFDPGATVDFEAEYSIMLQDAAGNMYRVLGMSIGPGYSNVVGWAFVGTPPPLDEPLTVFSNMEGPGSFGNPVVPYTDLIEIECFTPGAMIRTEAGYRPIDTLSAGDEIWTADHGYQPVRGLCRSTLAPQDLARHPELRPVTIPKGAFGRNCPTRDLVLSPCHRVVHGGWRSRVLFGETQVLSTARTLNAALTAETSGAVTYLHLILDRHEIVDADGILTESYQPHDAALDRASPETREELFRIFPEMRTGDLGPLGQPARPVLRDVEAQLLIA